MDNLKISQGSNWADTTGRKLDRIVAPLRHYFSPRFYGIEGIQLNRPTLFIGNHTIYGLLDVPIMIDELYKTHGILLKSMADKVHYKIPGWRKLLSQMGAVLGTRENCAQMMARQEPLLIYPGGGREVFKRKGEQYQLIWKQRTGFAEMAIEWNYQIIPFACVGPEECFDIQLDANDFQRSPLGRALRNTKFFEKDLRKGELIAPIATGLGITPLPKPQPFYFSFGQAIPTDNYKKEDVWTLRELAETSVKEQIDFLQKVRREDKNISPLRKQILKL